VVEVEEEVEVETMMLFSFSSELFRSLRGILTNRKSLRICYTMAIPLNKLPP